MIALTDSEVQTGHTRDERNEVRNVCLRK